MIIKSLLTRYLWNNPGKIKLFDSSLGLIISNNDRIILKLNDSVLTRQNLSSLNTNFILNLYVA